MAAYNSNLSSSSTCYYFDNSSSSTINFFLKYAIASYNFLFYSAVSQRMGYVKIINEKNYLRENIHSFFQASPFQAV